MGRSPTASPSRCAAFLSLVLLAVGATPIPVFADEPEYERHERFRNLLLRYTRDVEEAVARCRRELVGQVLREDGTPYPEEEILKSQTDQLDGLRARLANLDAARQSLRGGSITLTRYYQLAQHEMHTGLEAAGHSMLNESSWRVAQLGGRSRATTRRFQEVFERRRRDLESREWPSTAAWEAAAEAMRREFELEESESFRQLHRDYDEVTRRLLVRRRTLAGDIWALQDFFLRRGQNAEAEWCRTRVYGLYSFHDLTFTDQGRNDSMMDGYALRSNGDALIAVRAFRFATRLDMDEALIREPVETLRTYDDTLAPLDFEGDDLEQLARVLAARLERYRAVSDEYRSALQRIGVLCRDPNLPSGTLDPDDLVRLANAVQERFRAQAEVRRPRRDSGEQVLAAERSWNEAVLALARAQSTREARSAIRERDRIAGRLRDYREQLEDPGINEDQKRGIRENGIPRLVGELRTFEARLQELTGNEIRAERAAHQALVDRRREHDRFSLIPDIPDSEVEDAWQRFRAMYNERVRALHSSDRSGVPEIPERRTPERIATAPTQADALVQRWRQVGERVRSRMLQLIQARGDVERANREMVLLARSIVGLRVVAAARSKDALRSIRDGEAQDPLEAQFERLEEGLTRAKEFAEDASTALERAEFLRTVALTGNRGARVIETASHALELLSRAIEIIQDPIGRINSTAGAVLAFDEILSKLRSPREAAEGMVELLEFAAEHGGDIPLLGEVLGNVLDVYGEVSAACIRGIIAIQDRLVEDAYIREFTNAERHLYSRQEIEEKLITAGTNDESVRRRVATLVHARRLAFLASATPELARDMGGRERGR
jgi:hypothetical protein